MIKRKKVGLALGSGAFRGFSLIGVLRVLKENNIPIDYISGVSIGSLIGAYYAVYGDLDTLEKEIVGHPRAALPTILDLGLKGGLVSGKKFEAFVERILGKKDFKHTNIPLFISATDLNGGQSYVFTEGKLSKAVRASCSVPMVFEPTKIKNHRLVDGGLSDPVPVDILKKAGADIVIAVNLYHKNEFIDKRFTITKVALRSTRIVMYHLAQASIKHADVVVEPDLSTFVQTNKFRRYFKKDVAEAMIKIGAKEMKKHIAEIKSKL